jgi:predicted Rdx family selenoprotein
VGSNGIFEVAVDGRVVASKTRSGFPEDEDVVNAVSRTLSPE